MNSIDDMLEHYERLAELDVDYEDRAAPYLKAALLADLLELVDNTPTINDGGAWKIDGDYIVGVALRDKLKKYFGEDNA